MAIRSVLEMEYYLCNAFFHNDNSDVYEGIRSVVIDKDRNPKWKHKSVADVTSQEVEKLFSMRYGISIRAANYMTRPF